MKNRGLGLVSDLVRQYGKENLVFFADLFDGSNIEPNVIECYISESRYLLTENYKTTLVAADASVRQHFYLHDLDILIRDDSVKVFVKGSPELEEFRNTLAPDAPLSLWERLKRIGNK